MADETGHTPLYKNVVVNVSSHFIISILSILILSFVIKSIHAIWTLIIMICVNL